MGLERAHAQLLGQGQGPAVVDCRWLALGGLVMHSDVAEEVECPSLVASAPVRLGERVRLCGKGVRVIETPGQQAGVAQPDTGQGLKGRDALCTETIVALAWSSTSRASRERPASA